MGNTKHLHVSGEYTKIHVQRETHKYIYHQCKQHCNVASLFYYF